MNRLVTLTCSSCGAPLELAEGRDTFTCEHCGSAQRLVSSGGRTIARAAADIAGALSAIDKVAAELAVQRLPGEIRAIERRMQAAAEAMRARYRADAEKLRAEFVLARPQPPTCPSVPKAAKWHRLVHLVPVATWLWLVAGAPDGSFAGRPLTERDALVALLLLGICWLVLSLPFRLYRRRKQAASLAAYSAELDEWKAGVALLDAQAAKAIDAVNARAEIAVGHAIAHHREALEERHRQLKEAQRVLGIRATSEAASGAAEPEYRQLAPRGLASPDSQPSRGETEAPKQTPGSGCVGCLVLAAFLLGLMGILGEHLGCGAPRPSPRQVTSEDRAAIVAACKAAGLPSPVSIEMSSAGYLAATFEVTGATSRRQIQAFGEKAVITVRNAVHATGRFDSFRATINGPSPGSGLVLRYGSARLTDADGRVAWEEQR